VKNVVEVSLEKIQELRKMIPVGMMDAKQFIEESKGDLEKARTLFIEAEIEKLHQLKGEDRTLIAQLFFDEDYDINRTIDKLDDVIFDREFDLKNYETRPHDLNMTDAWLLTVQSFGFMNSLQTADFDSIVLVVKEIGLPDFANELDVASRYLAEQEVTFRELSEEALIDAVEGLKKSEKFQTALESFKLNVMLNPDFFKILKRMQKNITK
jgi:hypothetical protein